MEILITNKTKRLSRAMVYMLHTFPTYEENLPDIKVEKLRDKP